MFTFSNQAGLDMLETTLVSLQDITLEKIFDENGRKTVCLELPQIMQQVQFFYILVMIWFLKNLVTSFHFLFITASLSAKNIY